MEENFNNPIISIKQLTEEQIQVIKDVYSDNKKIISSIENYCETQDERSTNETLEWLFGEELFSDI